MLASVCVHAADENEREVRVGQHGAWTTYYRVLDTFDDSPIRWYAAHPQGSFGSIRYECTIDGTTMTRMLTAHADNIFITSIGQVMNSDPIRVRVKVDDNPIIEAKGEYPNTISDASGLGTDRPPAARRR